MLTVFFVSAEINKDHTARLYDSQANLIATIVATKYPTKPNVYTFDVPTTPAIPEQSLFWTAHRTSNGNLRASGRFYWNGTRIVYPEETSSALDGLNDPTIL